MLLVSLLDLRVLRWYPTNLSENVQDNQIESTKELDLLLGIIPPRLKECLHTLDLPLTDLIEIVMDLGRNFEVRFPDSFSYLDVHVTREDLDYIIERISVFGEDNRAGIERTLHRISAIRNRQGVIIGLTLRVGRSLKGTIDMIRDIVEEGNSLLLLGKPGVGKTTLLREVARVLADELKKRVVIVDTSNEIAGDGDIPHPGIGHARRMQVAHVDQQHHVMIEAVENHMPEVVIIDEIGSAEEALAARTIAERGVQLIATAHGISLKNLVKNPTLADLIGGIQVVVLGDDEARRRGSQKTVTERKALPTFNALVELQDRQTMILHRDVATSVDLLLRNQEPQPEMRVRLSEGGWELQEISSLKDKEIETENVLSMEDNLRLSKLGKASVKPLRVFPLGLSRKQIDRVIYRYGMPIQLTRDLKSADAVLASRDQNSHSIERQTEAYEAGITVVTLRSQTVAKIAAVLKSLMKLRPDLQDLSENSLMITPLDEAEQAIEKAIIEMKPIELTPQEPYVRRLQHELIEQSGLRSRSTGIEPQRRVVIYP